MTALLDFQRTIARAVTQPLTSRDTMKRDTRRRDTMRRCANQRETAAMGAVDAIALVKPNSRLSSLERLEIYSRSYWSRVLDALGEDFPGVRAVVGAQRFDRLRRAYLSDCPSESFTMRNLGRHLPAWMERHPEFAGPNQDIALDIAKLEWAQIESFDAAEYERLGPAGIAALDAGSTLRLQPHLRWMQASSDVDTLLLEVRSSVERDLVLNQARNKGRDQIYHRGRALRALPAKRIARARFATSPTPLCLAIHRHELVVHYKRLDAEMFRLLEALGQPLPIGEALEIAYANSTLTAEQCRQHAQESFALFASLGWFCKPGPHPSKELL
jgi:hypothetical protein